MSNKEFWERIEMFKKSPNSKTLNGYDQERGIFFRISKTPFCFTYKEWECKEFKKCKDISKQTLDEAFKMVSKNPSMSFKQAIDKLIK